MKIIRHDEQPQHKSYLSKISGRAIVNADNGSSSAVVWEQFMPEGGYVPAHCHEEEEILTFLSGEVEITADGETATIAANTTVLFEPHVVHSLRNAGTETVRMFSCHPTKDPRFIYTKEPFGRAWNSNSRALLNRHFSTAETGWHRWFFDQLDLAEQTNLLELGCGSGDLWSENEDRLPSGWRMCLSDFSPTMLNNARRNLRHVEADVTFERINANSIPKDDDTFGAVIANHLLYYTADWERGIEEIARVLAPGGVLYASTTGTRHLRELSDLVEGFDPEADFWGLLPAEPFDLANGLAALSRHFSQVEVRHYDDHLKVDEADPLVDFVLSTNAKSRLTDDRLIAFIDHVESRIRSEGSIRITRDEGLFIARL